MIFLQFFKYFLSNRWAFISLSYTLHIIYLLFLFSCSFIIIAFQQSKCIILITNTKGPDSWSHINKSIPKTVYVITKTRTEWESLTFCVELPNVAASNNTELVRPSFISTVVRDSGTWIINKTSAFRLNLTRTGWTLCTERYWDTAWVCIYKPVMRSLSHNWVGRIRHGPISSLLT